MHVLNMLRLRCLFLRPSYSRSVKTAELIKLVFLQQKLHSQLTLRDGIPLSPKILAFSYCLWIFTVRRYALHGICYSNSVCPSVCPSVTLVDCVHMVRPTIMISSPQGSPIILASGDITLIPKFEGGHPKRGR